jgi:hypothetical protein
MALPIVTGGAKAEPLARAWGARKIKVLCVAEA